MLSLLRAVRRVLKLSAFRLSAFRRLIQKSKCGKYIPKPPGSENIAGVVAKGFTGAEGLCRPETDISLFYLYRICAALPLQKKGPARYPRWRKF